MSGRRGQRWRRWALGVFLLSAPACARRADPSALGIPLSEVRYAVGVDAPPARFENAHGQAITLSAAYLSYASLGLGRCAVTAPAAKSAALLRELFGLPRAHAGHDGVLDPSFSNDGWVIDLRKSERPRLLSERYFPATAYCRAQSVLAAAHESYAGYPRDLDMQGYTLHVRGRFEAAGVARDFVLETDLPYGSLSELPPGGAPSDRGYLTIVHDLRAALQDIDLLHAEPEAASKQLLRALVDRAHVTFTRTQPK